MISRTKKEGSKELPSSEKEMAALLYDTDSNFLGVCRRVAAEAKESEGNKLTNFSTWKVNEFLINFWYQILVFWKNIEIANL